MRKFTQGWLSMTLLASVISPVAAQDAHVTRLAMSGSDVASVPAKIETQRSAPGSFDEVMDRVVDREHLLLAQMHNL